MVITKAYLYLVLRSFEGIILTGICRKLGRLTTFETAANYERLSECVCLCV